jgi:hypothetical protein
MAVRKTFIFTSRSGREYTFYGDSAPTGHLVAGWFERQTTKRGGRPAGPNFDSTWNSIRAARLYAAARPTKIWLCWLHMYQRNGQWIKGEDFQVYGASSTRRIRDLRPLGWPLELRPPKGGGQWYYRLNLRPARTFRIVPDPQ